jgi:hypothetical protein
MASVEVRTIRTDSGALDLIPATTEELRGIARYWPMELVGPSDATGTLGLVFQHGDEEIHGIKIQPPDASREDAQLLHHVNRAVIASALPHYLERQHRGVMVPCAYYKEKESGKAESGIALFVGPDPASLKPSDTLFDRDLGVGATPMVFDMASALTRARKACCLPGLPVIGFDLRPRLAMGGLAMHFVIEGPRVFVIKDSLDEREPIWEHFVRAGFSKVPYAPMRPAGLAAGP